MRFTQFLLSGLIAGAMLTGCGHHSGGVTPDPTASLQPGTAGTLSVTVTDNNGTPVVGASVTLTNSTGAVLGTPQTTDATGTASFSAVPAGAGYTVTAMNNGVTGSQTGLSADGTSRLLATVMLVAANGPVGTVSGSIIDGVSGRPLVGATVGVAGTQTQVQTQADGSYVLKGVPAGNPMIQADANGYAEARQPVTVSAGALQPLPPFKLFPTGNNTGRLGDTIISSRSGVLEIGSLHNTVWHGAGAYEARPLPNGNLLIANGSAALELGSGNFTAWQFRPLLLGRMSAPQGIAREGNGLTLIADTNNNRILEVTPSDQVNRTIATSLNHPAGVDYCQGTDTVLISDTGNHRVIEVDRRGAIVWGVGDGTTGLLNHPGFASRLANGNTLITDTGNHRVMEVNSQQQLVWMYGGKGDRTTCYFPNSAVRLQSGNTLIADTGNNRAIEVNPAGSIVWQQNNLDNPTFADRF
jgi:hypothetical protein